MGLGNALINIKNNDHLGKTSREPNEERRKKLANHHSRFTSRGDSHLPYPKEKSEELPQSQSTTWTAPYAWSSDPDTSMNTDSDRPEFTSSEHSSDKSGKSKFKERILTRYEKKPNIRIKLEKGLNYDLNTIKDFYW